jgi:hypothetical protein
VDDILLIRNDIPMMEAVKSSLRKSFSMKHLGEAAYILGIKIYRDRSKRHCWGYFFYMYHQLVLSGIPTRSLDLRSILFLTRCSCALLDCQTLLGNWVVIKVVFESMTNDGMGYERIKMEFVHPR